MNLKIIGHGRVNSLVNDNDVVLNANDKEVGKSGSNTNGNFKYDEKEIAKAIEKLNKELAKEKSHAEYSVYKKLNAITIKIINDETKEVIMELPPEKILDLVSKMCELDGIIVDRDV